LKKSKETAMEYATTRKINVVTKGVKSVTRECEIESDER
jgi:hypothetical protein